MCGFKKLTGGTRRECMKGAPAVGHTGPKGYASFERCNSCILYRLHEEKGWRDTKAIQTEGLEGLHCFQQMYDGKRATKALRVANTGPLKTRSAADPCDRVAVMRLATES